MTRTTTAIAALAGLIIGSVTTVAATTFLCSSSPSSGIARKKTKKDKDDEDDDCAVVKTSMVIPHINEVEHTNFLSDMLNRLWPHIAIAGADEIRATVEPMFKETMPGPLANLRFTKIDLGKVPIVLDNIVVHELRDGNVQFDLDITWDSDSDIQLKADYVGSFGVKSIKLDGRMTFLLKPLTNTLPIVSAIQYAFINPPFLELDFTGLANIADFSVIDRTIRGIMQDVMANMMVLPYRKLYKMDAASDFRMYYQGPVGVARITCVTGRGFVVEKKLIGKDDVPDVYCTIALGQEQVWKTSSIKDNLSPIWNEAKDFLLSDNDQIVSIEAWDEDSGTLDADDYLGKASVSVADLLLAGKTMEVELQRDGNITGTVTLHCEVFKFTASSLSLLEGPKNENQLAGLLTIIVTRALDLPCEKKDAASCVKIIYGSQEFSTGVVVDEAGCDGCNPVYDAAFLVPLAVGDSSHAIKMQVWNGDTKLGETVIQHGDLVASPNQTLMERRKVVGETAIEFSVSLMGVPDVGQEPVIIADAPISGVPAKDTVRISIVSGRGFQVKSRRLKKDDIPDIYCEVTFGSSPTIWRTATIKDSIAPEWKDESSDYTMTSNNQTVVLNVYDANRRGADDHVGTARITVGKVLLCGGLMDLEIQKNGAGTGAYILVRCDKL